MMVHLLCESQWWCGVSHSYSAVSSQFSVMLFSWVNHFFTQEKVSVFLLCRASILCLYQIHAHSVSHQRLLLSQRNTVKDSRHSDVICEGCEETLAVKVTFHWYCLSDSHYFHCMCLSLEVMDGSSPLCFWDMTQWTRGWLKEGTVGWQGPHVGRKRPAGMELRGVPRTATTTRDATPNGEEATGTGRGGTGSAMVTSIPARAPRTRTNSPTRNARTARTTSWSLWRRTLWVVDLRFSCYITVG